MFQAAAGMRAFILQVKVNTGKIIQFEADQMCIRRTLKIGINFIDGVANPGRLHAVFP
jgi:hypothetical protein